MSITLSVFTLPSHVVTKQCECSPLNERVSKQQSCTISGWLMLGAGQAILQRGNLFMLSTVGVSPPILQRRNLCCPLWVWAHPCCSERKPVLSTVVVSTPILFRDNLCCPLWVWAHPYCSERKPVLSTVGVSTPILFREGIYAVHWECEHTHTVQRGNLCCPLGVWAHPYCSERKSVLSIASVSTPILFRKKTCCSVNCGCEHTHTVQGGKLLCCPLWTPTHTFREETLQAMCFHRLSSPCDDLTNTQ